MERPLWRTVWQFLKELNLAAAPAHARLQPRCERWAAWRGSLLLLLLPPLPATCHQHQGCQAAPLGPLPDHQAFQPVPPRPDPFWQDLLGPNSLMRSWRTQNSRQVQEEVCVSGFHPGSTLTEVPTFIWHTSAPPGGVGGEKQPLASKGGPGLLHCPMEMPLCSGYPPSSAHGLSLLWPLTRAACSPERRLQRPWLTTRRFCPLEKASTKNSLQPHWKGPYQVPNCKWTFAPVWDTCFCLQGKSKTPRGREAASLSGRSLSQDTEEACMPANWWWSYKSICVPFLVY